ncbi:TlpA family protein disulfide reductase [Epilithonimonas arachidiradicis]|uniref:Thiol:disulfide interchange protein n=1 Tax=Epilithonimonas arachidiradicis TaxID=1617282 RepID=A0A420D7Y1_9FLAO|nr:TlpA disulfide reductase family protein [Epilithonimonas arachidiradicis]RKE86809.1 thioredoxin-like protein [Epilithonimonas arachidiradicis]GGG61849.1 thiol:disulfide interchange protein [Epilithonimonas arachidiradicis]
MRRKLLIIFGIIFIVLFVIYNVGVDIGSVHLGKQADNIEKNNKYDIQSSLFYKDYLKSDKLVVVNLWATWCQPCIQEMPMFLKLRKEYPDVAFVTLSIDKDSDKLKNYLEKNKEMPDITFENSDYRKAIRNFLEKRDLKSLYYIDIVPVTYFIKNGKVLKKIEGSSEREELITNINTLK